LGKTTISLNGKVGKKSLLFMIYIIWLLLKIFQLIS